MTIFNKIFDGQKFFAKNDKKNSSSTNLRTPTSNRNLGQGSTEEALMKSFYNYNQSESKHSESMKNKKKKTMRGDTKSWDFHPSVRRRTFFTLFGPCAAVIALLVVLQAAAFIFLHHQLDRESEKFFYEQESLHRQMIKLLEEFRKLKIEAAYAKSIREFSLLHTNPPFENGPTDDEDMGSGVGGVAVSNERYIPKNLRWNFDDNQDIYHHVDGVPGHDVEWFELSGDGGQWNDIEDSGINNLNDLREKEFYEMIEKERMKEEMKSKKSKSMPPKKFSKRKNEVISLANAEKVEVSKISSKKLNNQNRSKRSTYGVNYRNRYNMHQRYFPPSRLANNRLNRYYDYSRPTLQTANQLNQNNERRSSGRTSRGVSREYESILEKGFSHTSSNPNLYSGRNQVSNRQYLTGAANHYTQTAGDYRNYRQDQTDRRIYSGYDYARPDLTSSRIYDSSSRSPYSSSATGSQIENSNTRGYQQSFASTYNSGTYSAPRRIYDTTSTSTTEKIITSTSAPGSSEFVNDEEVILEDGLEGNKTLTDEQEAEKSWLQLTSYAKIPVSKIYGKFSYNVRNIVYIGIPIAKFELAQLMN